MLKKKKYSYFYKFVRDYYNTNDYIPLHAPIFNDKEENFLVEAVKSTYVSSVGKFVNEFENLVSEYTDSPDCIAVVNGTAALHIALLLANVEANDIVITQAFTFIATCNAIRYCNAEPVFIDIDTDTLSISPIALENWLEANAKINSNGVCVTKDGEKTIKACVPVHIFGHPAKIEELTFICKKWNIVLVEDASESLGSFYKNKHTGTFGFIGVLSFNGNKIITTGGGGMIMASGSVAKDAKHITTTAKRPHPYEFDHDRIGFNYRMPNINAALGCAQIQKIELFVQQKRNLAELYRDLYKNRSIRFFQEPIHCRSNYWLNTLIFEESNERDEMLRETNAQGIMTRPPWKLMNELPMYKECKHDGLLNSISLQKRIINVPSSVRIK